MKISHGMSLTQVVPYIVTVCVDLNAVEQHLRQYTQVCNYKAVIIDKI